MIILLPRISPSGGRRTVGFECYSISTILQYELVHNECLIENNYRLYAKLDDYVLSGRISMDVAVSIRILRIITIIQYARPCAFRVENQTW